MNHPPSARLVRPLAVSVRCPLRCPLDLVSLSGPLMTSSNDGGHSRGFFCAISRPPPPAAPPAPAPGPAPGLGGPPPDG
eukprot:CAMPEP_0182565904 /NCGR_PEP_ID=MMETSP1324-20130603/7517_1 /TAXON_ID=236786 /ORGANISM="Florenciella sp., Strain RCC1587" /LENGTH=78 /DNA_ID=CAMNT_0024779635 /DNA_START=363 /DNA_END=595 /DNA_ORIENTATION=-